MSKSSSNVGRPRRKPGLVRDVAAAAREAATQLFSQRGFLGTNMRDIAKASGVTSGALYHHYPSKEALLTEVIEDVMAREERALGSLLLPELSATQSLLILLHHHRNATDNHAALLSAMEYLPEDKRANIAAFFSDHLAKRVQTILCHGIETKEFREHETLISTWTILSVMRGIADIPHGITADLPLMTLELLLTGLGPVHKESEH